VFQPTDVGRLLILVIALVTGIIALLWFVNTLAFVGSAVAVLSRGRWSNWSEPSAATTTLPFVTRLRVLFSEEATGHQVWFASSLSSNPPAFQVDEQVTVLYSLGRPEKGIIQGLFSIWGGVTVGRGIGRLVKLWMERLVKRWIGRFIRRRILRLQSVGFLALGDRARSRAQSRVSRSLRRVHLLSGT
jgi:hypothetical protein